MTDIPPKSLQDITVIGAHCEDIVIGAGATLRQIAQQHQGAVIHALVLTGGGTIREIEEKNALVAMCHPLEVQLTAADLPVGRLSDHWGQVKGLMAQFRQGCEPDLVFAPQSDVRQQDHRVVAELVPTEFSERLILSYEVLKWESELSVPTLYLPIPAEVARRKASVLQDCYRSTDNRDWFDDEAFLGLMRIRGVQCRSHYAEGFIVEQGVPDFYSLCSPN